MPGPWYFFCQPRTCAQLHDDSAYIHGSWHRPQPPPPWREVGTELLLLDGTSILIGDINASFGVHGGDENPADLVIAWRVAWTPSLLPPWLVTCETHGVNVADCRDSCSRKIWRLADAQDDTLHDHEDESPLIGGHV